MPLEPGFGIMPRAPHSLSVTYPLCGLALIDTMDNPSEMWPLKLTDFCLFLYHQSYTILLGPLISPMAFTSCHDRGLNQRNGENCGCLWRRRYSVRKESNRKISNTCAEKNLTVAVIRNTKRRSGWLAGRPKRLYL